MSHMFGSRIKFVKLNKSAYHKIIAIKVISLNTLNRYNIKH